MARFPSGTRLPSGTGLLASTGVRQAVAVIAVGAVVGFVGPFGTFDELGLGGRLLYWEIIANLSWWQWQALDWGLARLDSRRVVAWWLRGVLVSLLTPVAVVFQVRLLRTALDLPTGVSNLDLYLWIAGTSLAIFATVAGFLLWVRSEAAAPEPIPPRPLGPAGEPAAIPADPSGSGAPPPQDGESRFLARLPMAKRGALLCISSEDHYLRVHTETGEDLILLRFGDALAELDGADGLRVHRSHWVARRAVVASRRAGRKTRLSLINGLEVPVSETSLPALKAAGWIA